MAICNLQVGNGGSCLNPTRSDLSSSLLFILSGGSSQRSGQLISPLPTTKSVAVDVVVVVVIVFVIFVVCLLKRICSDLNLGALDLCAIVLSYEVESPFSTSCCMGL